MPATPAARGVRKCARVSLTWSEIIAGLGFPECSDCVELIISVQSSLRAAAVRISAQGKCEGIQCSGRKDRRLDINQLRAREVRKLYVRSAVLAIITATFALLVFFTVLTYGLYKNGLKFFKIFVPPGVPIYILPLVVAIEIVSFLSRPLSHSVRLFANMLAGHITLKVFAGFVAMLGTSLGAIGWIGGIAPLALTVALTALELLVAFLQAYVFAILTCIYLNDAIHPGH
jgi:ATP synthase A chain